MNEELYRDIALRIRELREICDFTQQDMADELGVPLEEYQSYEESGKNIPISAIYEIAHKCNVDFSEIATGVEAKLDTYHVVRQGNGRNVSRYPGYRFIDLAHRYSGKIMQPLLVTLDPSDKPAELVSHNGQEFNYVLEGQLILVFDDKELLLEAGDCVYFNPTHPHGQKCAGGEKTVFLTVIAE